MKTKMLAACMLAIITLGVYSCNGFSKNKTVTKSNIIGTWRVIDFWEGIRRERTKNDFAKEDSTLTFTFRADSSMLGLQGYSLHDTLTLKYYVDEHAQKIFVRIMGTFESYNVASLQEDTLTVFTDDNKHLVLSKQH